VYPFDPSRKLFAYQDPAPSFLATVRRFPSEVERDVAILDHVPVSPDRSGVSSEAQFGDHTTTEDPLYLPPHGQSKENEKVHEQDGPVNRYVGGSGQGASQRDEGGLCSRKPEFELFCFGSESTQCHIVRNRVGVWDVRQTWQLTWQTPDEGSEFLIISRSETAHQPGQALRTGKQNVGRGISV
jgi:hypothetical protein